MTGRRSGRRSRRSLGGNRPRSIVTPGDLAFDPFARRLENTTAHTKKIHAQPARACEPRRRGLPRSPVRSLLPASVAAAATATSRSQRVGDTARVRRSDDLPTCRPADPWPGPDARALHASVDALGSRAGTPCHMRAQDSPRHATCRPPSRVAPTNEPTTAGPEAADAGAMKSTNPSSRRSPGEHCGGCGYRPAWRRFCSPGPREPCY